MECKPKEKRNNSEKEKNSEKKEIEIDIKSERKKWGENEERKERGKLRLVSILDLSVIKEPVDNPCTKSCE